MPDHHEVELTWAPAADAEVPDLTGLPGVVAVERSATDDLSAVYFDTVALSLMAGGVTLRRREGGADQGWHLKVPAGAGRDEVHLPLARARYVAPKPLREAVSAWSRGAALTPVATVDTHRTTYRLLGADRVVLAELADDRVRGCVPDEGSAPVEWREWELELVAGNRSLLKAATRLLAAQGVEVSEIQRKVERVLGDRVPRAARAKRPKPGRSAGRVLLALLVEQRAELARRDSEIRRREPDSVHTARVATRRIRSALGAYGPLLDAELAGPVSGELRWLARTLGDSRDLEVVHARLLRLVDEEPADLVVGPVRRRVDAAYAVRQREADQQVLAALESPRYLDLLASLDRLVLDAPWTDLAGRPARDVLPPLVAEEWKALRRRVRAIADAEDHDAAVHDARKAAKRLRYVVEALVPVWGDDARNLAQAAKRMSSMLGDRQDSVVARHGLLELAAMATAAGENGFTYGRLHAREEAHARRLDHDFDVLWSDILARKRLRAWLR
ncbi:CYTH and CHAD domain-containing protein [Nocardioides ungokensis]|uniref:CYTH and CHAD domain-containing protein n=1 Tax=Nocardioides ungokensis TaxID=1643322 RepID=UPI0015DFD327|nr:CYTH and CHAD domain-containing protein [Nocardioides ungokensis]